MPPPIPCALAAAGLALAACAPRTDLAWAGTNRPQVLYLTHMAGYRHEAVPVSEQVMRELAASSGAFEVSVVRDAATVTADTLRGCRVVMFNTTGELPLSADAKRALLAFVREGNGFVGVHSATDTFYDWPAYGELVGGYFDGHPWTQPVTVKVEAAGHPAVGHLAPAFTIDDEIYQFRSWSRAGVDVLLSLDVASVDLSAPGVKRADRDFALAWTRRYGRGRVFYTALGHRIAVWQDPRYQRHLLEGIRWAMGGQAAAMPNTLTPDEQAAGWTLLFDGRTTSGWRGFRQAALPAGWQVVGGALTRTGQGGDIITVDQYESFELALEWKISEGGNSGIFFHVAEDAESVWHTGPEMQVLDNARHVDGRDPLTSAGSNYALHAPVRDLTRPVGEWNQVRIVVDGAHVEHWLNGAKVVEYELWSPAWERLVAASKFGTLPRYGRARRGHIALQDHGDPVAYRNIRIRRLPAK